MFKFLRSNAKFFYWVIAATFIAFIFVAWGMDMSGSPAPGRAGQPVGAVGGVEIPASVYDSTVREIQAQMRRNLPDGNLTNNQVAMAREQAWEQIVRDRIMAAEIEERGLAVTDQEILHIFQESPPPEILQAFVGENGQPDMQAYYAALGNPNSGIDWTQVERWVRQNVPRQKLAQMITAGVTVSEAEVRRHYREQTGRAVAEYMGVALQDVARDDEPTDAEIQAYYEDNPGTYHQPARGLAKVAAWEFTPAPLDFDDVRDLALDIKQSIESGEQTFASAAAIYSEDGTADQGGDLGTFDRNRMVAPFTEAAFSLPVGEISEPVLTQFGYHLIEVLEQEEEDGEVVRVHARHILLPVEAGQETRDTVAERAAAFRDAVTPSSFVSLADADTTAQLLEPRPFLEGRDIPGLSQSAAGGRFVFRAEPGEISPLFYTDDHVYVVMAEGLEPAGPRPLEDVRGQVVLALERQRQQAAARQKLSPAVGRVQMGETMEDVAADLGLLHAVTDTIGANSNVPDVGYATALNTVALEAAVGEVVPEVVTKRGAFAVRVLWQEPFDEEAWATRRERIRLGLLQQKQGQALEAWFEARKADMKIEDWRDEALAGI